MKTSLALAALAAAALSGAAAISKASQQVAVNPASGKPYLSPDQVPAGVYNIDTRETLVRYEVSHFGYSDYWGTFAGATGTLSIDPKRIEDAKLDVKIPISLIETTNRELDGKLLSDEFFDADDYPFIHFISSSVRRTGPHTASVTGQLTMHDVTRPVTLEVTFNGAGLPPTTDFGTDLILGFNAQGVVKRSDFGLGKFAPFVSDETRIVVSSSLKRAQ